MTLLQRCMNLPLYKQVRLVNALQANITRTQEQGMLQRLLLPRWERYYRAILDINGITELPVRSQAQKHCCARMCLAYRLRQDGYTTISIGQVLHRDHSSICSYIKIMNYYLSHPSMYPELMEMWLKFEKETKNETE